MLNYLINKEKKILEKAYSAKQDKKGIMGAFHYITVSKFFLCNCKTALAYNENKKVTKRVQIILIKIGVYDP